ncbi:MAG: GNAT family N-acetyltransferase [Spirochaetes bacterium]|nr:GNAT family N-acetyltransferase [Spirochaetota bacterium]
MIRDAALHDVMPMARLIVRAWKSAYEGIVDPGYVASLTEERFAAIFSKNIAGSLEIIYVYDEGTVVTGFISARRDEAGCQVIGFYVDPDRQGRGIGRELFERMSSHCSSMKGASMYLWTLQGARNNMFYESLGGVVQDRGGVEIGGRSYPGVKYSFSPGGQGRHEGA